MKSSPRRILAIRTTPGCLSAAVGAALLLALAPPGAFAASPPRLSSIALDPSSDKISLIPGETYAIRATATYTNGSTEDVTARMVYSSSKPEVVSIAGIAQVEARRSGDAEVSAVDPVSGKSARTKVKFKVAKLKGLELLPADKVVPVGETLALRAIGTYDNGRGNVDLTHAVTWSSDKTKLATVGDGPLDAGLVTGLRAGSVKIVAYEPGDKVKSSSDGGRLTVVERLLGVTVEPKSILVRNGGGADLSARGRFEGGATVDVSNRVEWISSDPAVAVVDAAGHVTALGIGIADLAARDTVTGTGSGPNGSASITVIGALLGLVVSPTSTTLPIGGNAELTALAAFEGVDDSVEMKTGVKWTTNNSRSFSIDPATGAGRCLAAGAATVAVTETESGASSSMFGGDGTVICVADADVVRTTPAAALLGIGKTKPIQAFLVKPNGTEQNVTATAQWTSSKPAVVEITTATDGSPRAKALSPGVAVLTARDPASGASSADPGGTVTTLSVPGPPRVVKIFPKPDDGKGLRMVVGTQFQLKARIDFEGGATQGANNLVEWVSSDPTILRVSNGGVDQPGRATPLRSGQVTVTARYPKPDGPPPPYPPLQPMSASVQVRVGGS